MTAASPHARRHASHSGSWYSSNPHKLRQELTQWLDDAASKLSLTSNSPMTRAIIVPHAGYMYSGSTAAYSYQFLRHQHASHGHIQRVFLLGPSHHQPFLHAMLPNVNITSYDTPLGSISLDAELIDFLDRTYPDCFRRLDRRAEENEHSLEMQLPYIFHVLNGKCKLIPLMIGHMDPTRAIAIGRILAPFFDNPSHFFVISSDFCHWGRSFKYTYYNQKYGPIWKFIKVLDMEGMNVICTKDPDQFQEYLSRTQNTICGREPIRLLLHILQQTKTRFEISLLHYEQSKRCMEMKDTSVSYVASAVQQLDGQDYALEQGVDPHKNDKPIS